MMGVSVCVREKKILGLYLHLHLEVNDNRDLFL